jgi:two-component system cell cycle response regulator
MRILIADDDATSRILLRAVASKLGHECVVAADGSSAWEMITSDVFDVLLTDWNMPGLEGPDLCRRVREEPGGRYVYVVLVTGRDTPGEILEGMGAGADDYLVKPVNDFAVRTRLVAAERVTALHAQLAETRAQLEQANAELVGLSLTDALTGLGNRRNMDDELERVHARSARAGTCYAVAVFDVDHFKLYNDYYGHPAGDEALRSVARYLQSRTRAGESVYRYGGEEFLLVLHECTAAGAAAAARRLVSAVEAAGIVHEVRPTHPPLLTVSAGVAAWAPGSEATMPEVVAEADRALFRAKAAGRNQVGGAEETAASTTS